MRLSRIKEVLDCMVTMLNHHWKKNAYHSRRFYWDQYLMLGTVEPDSNKYLLMQFNHLSVVPKVLED